MNSPAWLAARREVIARIRRRSFVVFTLMLCAMIIGAGVLFAVLDDGGRPSYDVGVVGTDAPQELESALIQVGDANDLEVDTVTVADGRAALEDGDVDVVLDVDGRTATWQHDIDAELSRVVDGAWASWSAATQAAEAGLDPAEIRSVLSPPPLTDDIVEPDDDSFLGVIVGFASAVLLFISITSFGSYVLTGVVEEKSTGVIEVLLSHVRAHQLMAGKVFGVGAVALVQFSAAVLAGLISLHISGIEVPSEIWVGLPVTIGWFIGGFLLYSTLFALAGSFVSRVEDAQGAAAPVTTAFTIGYVLVFTFGSDPTGTSARVLSILPPFAPLLMPLRMVTGAASIIEIVVAAVLLAASVAGMIRLAGSVYSRTLLHRGRRLTWREALRTGPAKV